MDYYLNKATGTSSRNFLEDGSRSSSPLVNHRQLPKSKSTNELAKKFDREVSNYNVNLSTWGWNKCGQLANSSTTSRTPFPTTLKNFPENPISFSAGEGHTAIITDKLKLYMSGANNFGQLGIEDLASTNRPTLIPSLSSYEIVMVACGSDHTFALTTKGEVFAWGSNLKGQLGLGDFENRTTPVFVSALAPSGNINTRLLHKHGGHKRNHSSSNAPQNGEGGFKDKSHSVDLADVNEPKDEPVCLLAADEKVTDIACGALHTLLKTDKNRLFATGFGETFALGYGQGRTSAEFKLVQLPKKNVNVRSSYGKNDEIEKIACGLTHSGCIRGGKAFLWGLPCNKESALLKTPTQIEFPSSSEGYAELSAKKSSEDSSTFIDIKLGDTLSVFLNSRGEVFTLGENIDGQLGTNSTSLAETPVKVGNIPINISSIACGRNHVLAISSELRQIYGWGSNSCGQLGIKNRGQNVLTPKPLASLNDCETFRIVCGGFHTLCLSYKPISSFDHEENDLLSDDESGGRNLFSTMSNTVDLQKYQDEIEKLKSEMDRLKNKNQRLQAENEELKAELVQMSIKNSENHLKTQKSKNTIDQGIQTIELPEEIRKSFDLDIRKNRKSFDKSPDARSARALNPQVEIDFKELVLEKQISEGGYGLIYRGRWRETIVAIKMLKIDMKEEHVRDFIYECYAMEALRHPNVVMFLGACTKPPNLAIVLEYCNRGSLWSVLQNPDIDLPWEQRRRIALDSAKGVNYLHSFNPPVLHRDLKSLNLLLDEVFRVKVADFGWTRTMATTMTGKIGTYQWMAPEVISSNAYTEKADVFSFGIILWEIAAREPPYRNISGVQVSLEVVNNNLRPTIPKKTPEAFAKLIKKCWDREPSRRPSFKEIIKELESMKLM